MSRAPNQTQEQYERQQELFRLKEQRELMDDEFKELRELSQITVSHLCYSPMKEKTYKKPQ